MATRATVSIHGVYLYQHWDGYDLAETVRSAMLKEEAWDDPSYLARIIFCEMVENAADQFKGFGIQPKNSDEREFCVFINCDKQEIKLEKWREIIGTYTFKEFIEFPFDENFEQVKK